MELKVMQEKLERVYEQRERMTRKPKELLVNQVIMDNKDIAKLLKEHKLHQLRFAN